MKRVWVIDESTAVRETLAIVLGGEYEVHLRTDLSEKGLPQAADGVDLVILGLSSRFKLEATSMHTIASQLPCPVLFLLDSNTTDLLVPAAATVECLTKPFNPYELKAKVGCLMALGAVGTGPSSINIVAKNRVSAYLKYPYLAESTAAIAKRFAETQLPLLIIGEVGSGQEEVARAICSMNPKAGPRIPVFLRDMVQQQTLQKNSQLTSEQGDHLHQATLHLAGLDKLDAVGQSALLQFLDDQESSGNEFRTVSTSSVDLLENVYRGEFLESLYYRLATLTIRIKPLRDRLEDLPDLVDEIAEPYGRALNLGKVSFSPGALERLGQYLWFGNIKELETVIARTLTVSRKRMVDSEDLVWSEPATSMDSKLGEVEPRDQDAVGAGGPEGRTSPTPSGPSNGDFSPIRNFVNELAHELKNPMVTVKTYAQLLAERFDDETFRTSFQDRVGSDIERMDDLVEALVEYSKYDQPKPEVVDLHGQLQLVLEALIPESVKREMSVRWGNRGEGAFVRVDQDQFRCAFKNLVLTALSQGKSNQEVQVNVNGQGEVTLSFVPEEGSPVFQGPQTGFTVDAEEEPLPLRVVLARDLLERMGGDIEVSHPGDSKVQFKVIVPTPSALN